MGGNRSKMVSRRQGEGAQQIRNGKVGMEWVRDDLRKTEQSTDISRVG